MAGSPPTTAAAPARRNARNSDARRQEAPTTNDRRRVEKQVEADDVGLQCLRQGEEEDCTTVIWRQWVLVKADDDGA